MDKTEIIFFAVVIIAYIICAVTLNIPLMITMTFAILLLVILAIAILLKYKNRLENKKISKLFNIISIILLILYIITTILELLYCKPIINNSGIFILLFIPMFFMTWYFKKEEE